MCFGARKGHSLAVAPLIDQSGGSAVLTIAKGASYPDEAHGFRRPKNRVPAYEELPEFFKEHLDDSLRQENR